MELNYVALFIIILIAFYTDTKKGIIPNSLTFSGIFIGLLYHLVFNGLDGLISSLIALLIGFTIFSILYFLNTVGAGDVKLFGAIGALTNTQVVLYIFVYSIIFAGIIGLCIIVYKRKALNYRFPFMYAVLPGTIVTYYSLYLL